MKEFNCTVREVREWNFHVEAEDCHKASDIARDMAISEMLGHEQWFEDVSVKPVESSTPPPDPLCKTSK